MSRPYLRLAALAWFLLAGKALSAFDLSVGIQSRTEYSAFLERSELSTSEEWSQRLDPRLTLGAGAFELALEGDAFLPSGKDEKAAIRVAEARAAISLGERYRIEAGRFLRLGSPAFAFPCGEFLALRRADAFPFGADVWRPTDRATLSAVFGDFWARASYSPFRQSLPKVEWGSAWMPDSALPLSDYGILTGSSLAIDVVGVEDEYSFSFADWSALIEVGWSRGRLSLEFQGYVGWDYENAYLPSIPSEALGEAYDSGVLSIYMEPFHRRIEALGLRAVYSGERFSAYLDSAWAPRKEYSVPTLYGVLIEDEVDTAQASTLDITLGATLKITALRSNLVAEYHRRILGESDGVEIPAPMLSQAAVVAVDSEPLEGVLGCRLFAAADGIGPFRSAAELETAPSFAAGLEATWQAGEGTELSLTLPYAWGDESGYFGQFGGRFAAIVELILRSR